MMTFVIAETSSLGTALFFGFSTRLSEANSTFIHLVQDHRLVKSIFVMSGQGFWSFVRREGDQKSDPCT